jgi:hypothetical protein
MALSRTQHGPYIHDNTGFTPQGTGPFTTSSFTPAAGALLVVFVICGATADGVEGDYVVTGGGLTWTKLEGIDLSFSGADGLVLQIWRAPGASGSSMQITLTHTGHDIYACGVFPFSYTGHDTSTPTNGDTSNSNTSTTNSLTLGATPATDDEQLAMIALVGSDGLATDVSFSAGSSFTEISEYTSTDSFVRWQAQRRTGSTSTAVSWTSSTGAGGGFDQRLFGAVNIKAAAAAAVTEQVQIAMAA